MKTRLIVFCMAVGSFQFLHAQKVEADKMAAYQTETMVSALDLNEDQIDEITAINTKYSAKSAELINAEGSMFGKMGDMRAIAKQKNAELEKVLTERQMEKYTNEVAPKMRQHMRKQMKD